MQAGTTGGRISPTRGYVLVLGAAVLFGINASVSKVVLDAGVSAERLTALRCTFAALGLLAIVLVVDRSRLRVQRREWPQLVALGIVGAALNQWFYFQAIDRLPVGIALLLEYTAPVIVALWSRVVLREQVRRRIWLALALALGGLALVAEVWRDTGLDPLGVLAGLGAATCLATYFLVGRHTVARRDPLSTTFWMFAVGAVVWTVLTPWWTFDASVLTADASLQGRLAELSAPTWLALGWVVVLGTLVPYALNMAGLRHLPATTVGILAMAEPVVAVAVAWVWLRQSLSPVQILGGLTVLSGVALAQTATLPDRDTGGDTGGDDSDEERVPAQAHHDPGTVWSVRP